MLQVNLQGKIIQTVCFIFVTFCVALNEYHNCLNVRLPTKYWKKIVSRFWFDRLLQPSQRAYTFGQAFLIKSFNDSCASGIQKTTMYLNLTQDCFFVTERALIFHETINNSSWNVTLINIKTTKLIAPEGYSQAILITKPPVLR